MSAPRIALLGCLALAFAGAEAQQAVGNIRYVDDVLSITVRTGRGTDFQILRTVESGEPVELLESSADGYSRVRLADGVTGWVLSRYLDDQPPARQLLAEAREAAELASDRAAALEDEVAALRGDNESLKAEMSRLFEERQTLDAELARLRSAVEDASSAPARLAVMRERVETLTAEAERLSSVNVELRDQRQRAWFLIGAGVLLGGILLGLLLPRLRPRRRSSWGSL